MNTRFTSPPKIAALSAADFTFNGGAGLLVMQEVWRPVVGYEGYYEVSNQGRLKSVDHFCRCFHKGRIIKMHPDKWGYWQADLCKDGIKKSCKIHQLLARAFLPNPLNLPEINHKDGHKGNTVLGNLEWCTSSQNRRHAFAIGIQHAARGEDAGAAKLKSWQILLIRNLRGFGIRQKTLAELFGVGQSNIGLIVNRKRWKHI